jgi:tetratricopeptide (TPR) repeat protein
MDRGTAITLGALVACVAIAAAAFGRAPKAAASSRVPTDPGEVLETVTATPGDPRRAQETTLRRVLAQDPENVVAAVTLARLEIDLARETSDPRHLGRAQAALGPWWDSPDAPNAILVLRATILQSLHDFERALADLDRALKREPRDGQAWLTRAVVLTVLARYDDARASCASGAPFLDELATVICETQIDSLTGKAKEAVDRLTRFLDGAKSVPRAEEAWARSSIAEYAMRASDPAMAELHLKRLLELEPGDVYGRALYADLLLDANRAPEAATLLRGREANDTLLLRLAIAEKRAKTPFADTRADLLGARFDASRARGDVVHRREEARYWLEVRDDAERALELAKANWDVQKEPADARILLEAALAAKAKKDAQPVLAWLAATKLQDPAIARVADELRR